MTDAGVSTGMGWWPKLVLWGAVIAAGSVYLLSVEQHRKDAVPPTAGHAALTLAATNAQVTSAPEPAPPAVSRPSPGPASAVAVPPAHPGPSVGAALPSAQRPASAAATPAAESPPEPPAPEPITTGPVPPRAATSAPATPVVPPPAVPQLAAVSEVSPVEARAFAEAVTEGRPTGQAPAASGSGPEPAPAPVTQQAVAAPPTPIQTPSETERARIFADYEAMRRAAEGDLQAPGVRAQRGPWGHRPYDRRQGSYGPAPYGAAGPGRGYAPTYPRW